MKPAPRLAPGGKDACCALIRELTALWAWNARDALPAWGWRIWRAACRRGKPSSWAISHARGTFPPLRRPSGACALRQTALLFWACASAFPPTWTRTRRPSSATRPWTSSSPPPLRRYSPRSGGKWSCPSIWKTMQTSPARARHSCGAARAERPICFICPSARAAAARCAWTENCAAARAAARAR